MDGDVADMGLSLSELKELHRLNKEKISGIEEEIHQYKQKFKMFGPEAELSQELRFIQRPDGSNNLQEIKEKLVSDILVLEARVKETAKLTGISIGQVEEHTELTEEVPRRSVDMTLKVLDRDIELRCEIDHVPSEDGQETEKGVVSWLEVKIEKGINDMIGDALSKSTQDVAIHSILCLIKSYLQCISERDRLIQHFTETYLGTVSHWIQGHTHRLKIASQDSKHPKFILEWDVRLMPSSRYTNHVTLQVEASNHLKALDSKGVLDSAADMFDHMTSTLGLEKAIDSFVQLVVSDGSGASCEDV